MPDKIKAFAMRHYACLLATSVALMVFSCRLVVVALARCDVPFFDEWNVIGAQVLSKHLRGELTWEQLLAPHNRHVLTLTRLSMLGLFSLNGAWDARLAMIVEAALAAIVGGVLVAATSQRLQRTGETIAATAAFVLLFLGIADWQNTLWGFQIQIFLLAVLSLAVLYAGTRDQQTPWTYFLLASALLANVFTMGAALIAAVATIGARLLRFAHAGAKKSDRIRHVVVIALCAGAVALSLYLDDPKSALNDLRPSSVGEWLKSLARYGGWPLNYAPVSWLASCGLIAALVRRELQNKRPAGFPLALLLWSTLLIITLSYQRAKPDPIAGELLASRYKSFLAIGAAATLLAAFGLIRRPHRRRWLVIAVWVLALTTAIEQYRSWPAVQKRKQQCRVQVKRLRGFVESRDIGRLGNFDDDFSLPYPNPQHLAGAMQSVGFEHLPPSLGGKPGPLSVAASTLLAASWGLAATSLVLTLSLLLMRWRWKGPDPLSDQA